MHLKFGVAAVIFIDIPLKFNVEKYENLTSPNVFLVYNQITAHSATPVVPNLMLMIFK